MAICIALLCSLSLMFAQQGTTLKVSYIQNKDSLGLHSTSRGDQMHKSHSSIGRQMARTMGSAVSTFFSQQNPEVNCIRYLKLDDESICTGDDINDAYSNCNSNCQNSDFYFGSCYDETFFRNVFGNMLENGVEVDNNDNNNNENGEDVSNNNGFFSAAKYASTQNVLGDNSNKGINVDENPDLGGENVLLSPNQDTVAVPQLRCFCCTAVASPHYDVPPK